MITTWVGGSATACAARRQRESQQGNCERENHPWTRHGRDPSRYNFFTRDPSYLIYHREVNGIARAVASVGRMGTFTIGGELEVHRLGFGAMRITGEGIWGPPDDPDEARRLLRRVVELGIDLIDTADSYGPEVSENLIAEALHPYPDDLVIATKGGLRRTGPGPVAARRAAGAAQGVLRGQPAAPEARPDRPLPAARARPEGALRGLGGRAQGAPGRGQDPPRGRLERLGRRSSSRRARSSTSCRCRTATTSPTATPSDVLEACERVGIGFIPWFPLATGRLAEPGGPLGRIAREHDATPAPDRAGLAARALAGDAADPRHLVDRAPGGEPGRHADRALALGGRGDWKRPSGVTDAQ